MHMRRAAAAALVFFLVSTGLQARTLDQVPAYLKKEGKFVSYPAIAMGGVGLVIGGVVALPAALVSAPIGLMQGDLLGYAILPSAVVATGGAEVGYNVGGAIPWALKKGFYDAPMSGIARVKGIRPSGLVAQVDPPPAVDPVAFQYLESTPADARIPVVPPRQYSAALPPPKEPTSLMLKRQLSPFKPPVYQQPRRAPRTASQAPAATAPVSPAEVPGAAHAMSAPTPVAPVRTREGAPAATAAAAPEPARMAPQSTPDTPSSYSSAPVADDEPVDAGERPTLRKKKRKFSDRFGF